jgi:hypothetical protein
MKEARLADPFSFFHPVAALFLKAKGLAVPLQGAVLRFVRAAVSIAGSGGYARHQ